MITTIEPRENTENTFVHQLHLVKQTAKEQELSDYILKHAREFVHMSIAEAADACGVSEATLVRFSKKLGYKGFQALKIHLAQEMTDHQRFLVDDIKEGDCTADIAQKVFASYRETLDATLEVVQPEMIDLAAKYIKTAKRIYFFGAGGSQAVAMDVANKFLRFGIPSFCYSDQNMQKMAAASITNEDVAIAISHTGATTSTIDALILAKANGAKTISITNFSRSPILKYSDVSLFTSSKEVLYQFESLSSRIAQLTVLDVLLNVIVMSDPETYLRHLNLTRSSLDSAKI